MKNQEQITITQFEIFSRWATAIITVLLDGLLLWQYFNGGIPKHHFLADESMPVVSNAWGALTIPLLTWFSLQRIKAGLFNNLTEINFPKNTVLAFGCAAAFGISLGLALLFNWSIFLENVPFIVLGLAVFFPVYKAEYFLGFVLGLTYFVGGVLPVVVGFMFLAIAAGINFTVRWIRRKLNF
ncbi:hypothetical protein SAMN05421780_102463 [Flexibacter flexilis DSM 6793]|uniref:Uncharacterized protein n=1 Tax=Flexibacter flexilis DSM 6793 TaxID=927664 RepID=A0A1I1G6I5_9BACT|nr:hypothetical protein [Flexibacter flexilis]SFC06946.1 hypothetical protein SAMN05421780_102463 [Flexibacter flexilis DSM 6793]